MCDYNFILKNVQISQTYCLRGATNVPSDVRPVQNVENSVKVPGVHFVQSDIIARSAAPFLPSSSLQLLITVWQTSGPSYNISRHIKNQKPPADVDITLPPINNNNKNKSVCKIGDMEKRIWHTYEII